MSLVPFQSAPAQMSMREAMQSIVFSRMSQDKSQEKYDDMMLAHMATSAIESIGQSNRSSVEGTVSAVQSLIGLGFSATDPVITELMESDARIRSVFTKIADRVPNSL